MVMPAEVRTEVVLHPLHGPGLDETLAGLPDISLVTPKSPDAVASALGSGAEVLVTFDWDDSYLVGPLRWIQAISAGVDQFPVDELRDAGVVLTSARGAHSPAVAEHAVALVLALLRRVGQAVRRSVEREWRPEPATEISGKTVCVIGFGSIGTEIAAKLRALGAHVIGVRRNPGPSPSADRVVGPEDLLDACHAADILICALPHTDETAGLVGAAELAALGRGWVVNVGRGSSLDEDALVEALVDGDLQGAALDVVSREPLPADSRLWDLPEVIVTPHMAWSTDRLNPRLLDITLTNLAAYRGEGEWLNRVV